MKWTQTQPIPNAVWTTDQISYHMRLDPDVSQQTAEQSYISDLQAAAVEAAEEMMAASLLNRTITATYYAADSGVSVYDPYPKGLGAIKRLTLPHGPVQSVTSVTDATNADIPYTLECYGREDVLNVLTGWVAPLTVTYVAGYGSTASAVPADIRQAIRTHIGTMYENRETVSDKVKSPVPHSLADFYKLKARRCPVAG